MSFTINIFYRGENGSAKEFAKEMIKEKKLRIKKLIMQID